MFREVKKLCKNKWFIFSLISVVILMILSFTNLISRYYQGIFTSICINIILVTSLNLLSGYLGELTLGHAGFMSIGAYVGAYITKDLFSFLAIEISFWPALIIGAIIAALIGFVVSFASLRLKGDYLAIITLAFGEIIKNILTNLELVGGAKGYMGISRFVNLPLALIIMFISVFLMYLLVNSQYGRIIKAISVDDLASNNSGIDTKAYKIKTFVIAAFFAGIAGVLYAHYMGNLAPKIFDYNMSIEILVMVVLGGMGNFKGGIISAIILTLLPELLRGFADYQMLAYALILIFMMLFKNNAKVNAFFSELKLKISKEKVHE